MAEEKPKDQTEEKKTDVQQLLMSQDMLFSHYLHEEDKPAMRKSIVIAVLMHAFVISITIPQVSLPELPKPSKPVIHVRRWRPPPPPKKQQPTKPKVEKVLTRKVPIPDETPEEPEPIVEPEPEPEEFFDIPLDAEILIGAPEPPPATDGILFAGVGGVTNPERIHFVKPNYPDIARKAKIEGDVILQAVIRADGSVGDMAVLKSPGAKFGFDEEAMRAVSQWRYKPALQGGKAVDVYFTVVVKFYLED
jgi:protein TonB